MTSARAPIGVEWLTWLIALALAVYGATASAAGAQTGRLKGGIYDAAGGPMADMSLVLRGSHLMQPMRGKSRPDGTYSFEGLPPGEDYTLEASGAGFDKVKEKGIKILLGQTTSVDLLLGEAAENLVVRAPNPNISTDTAQAAAVITADKAAATPIIGTVQNMAQMAPGVGGGTRPSTRGGLGRSTKFYVDGLDTSDVSDGSMTAPVNFNAVESFQVITGGQDAQYNSMGTVQNMVTKTGGNFLTYDAQVVASPDWLNASQRTPANSPGLFGQFTEPTGVTPAVTSFYAPHINIGGPVIRDKMWFFGSAQMNLSSTPKMILFRDGTQEVRPNDTTTLLARLKVTYQINSDDKISAALNLDHNIIENQIGSNTVTQAAETRVDRGGYFFIINYDKTISPDLRFSLQAGTTFKGVNTEPSSNSDLSSHRELNANLTQFNASGLFMFGTILPGNFLRESKYRYQLDPMFQYRMGEHDLKFGIQTSLMLGGRTTGVVGPYRYTDRGGICDEANPATFGYCQDRAEYFNTSQQKGDLTTNASNTNVGAFISDTWIVNRNVTVIPGFRLDVGQVNGDGGPLGTLVGLGPRLAATFDPLGDKRIVLTGYYGRSNDVGDIAVSQRGNPDLYTVTEKWNQATNSFPACTPTNILPGCTVAGGPAGRAFRPGNTPPHTDEFMLGVKFEALQDTAVGVDLSYRRYANLWVERETNRIWDLTGTRVVGYVDGQPRSVLMLDNPDSAYRDYKGVDLWVDGRPGPWDITASYTLSFTEGTVDDYFDGYMTNPRLTPLFFGPSNTDTRHALKGSIGYRTGLGLDVSVRFQYRTGTPLWESFLNPFDSQRTYRRSWRGTGYSYVGAAADLNNPDAIAQLRNPDFLQFDAQARYDLGALLHLRERLDVTLMFINLLNSSAPTEYSDAWSFTGTNTFGGVKDRMRPLQVELILRFYN